MDILIRKIQRKGKGFVFMPNSKSGYKFNTEDAQPRLTEFQKSCIQVKAQKDRKLGSFWTPNFCCIGALMVQNGEANLTDLLGRGSLESITSFNNHFPDKKWYWYDKAAPENLAMLTYFIGVRAAASILAYYYNLLKKSKIKEAEKLYKKHLVPLGIARLLIDADSNLVCDEDDLYMIKTSGKDCIIKADLSEKDKFNNNEEKEPVKEIVNKPSQTVEEVKTEVKTEITKNTSMVDDAGVSGWEKPISMPKKAKPFIVNEAVKVDLEQDSRVSEDGVKPKKNPNKLPRIGNNE